jgi:HEAT repeat protein
MSRPSKSALARPRALLGDERRRARRQAAAALALGLLGFALARPSWAQSNASEAEEDAPAASVPTRGSLLGRFGLEPRLRLLDDTAAETRIRGIKRLARIGTPAALQALVDFALKRAGRVSSREWLTLMRGLSAHVDHAPSRQLLASLIVQPTSGRAEPVEDPLRVLVRDGAALALAHDGRDAALAVLGQALRSEGAAGEAALRALVAHPPRRLQPLVDAPGEPTALLARWLGLSADPSAAARLRQLVRTGSVSVRAEAAIALTRLGDSETPELAVRWLGHASPELRAAALEILTLRKDARALAPLAERLQQGPLDAALAGWALRLADPRLEPALLERLERPDANSAPWLWAVLAQSGGERAATRLARALATPDGVYAAHALYRMPDGDAERALQRTLEHDGHNALALRAASARGYVRDDDFPDLNARLERLEASPDPNLRALGAWGLALQEPGATLAALRSGDEARTLGAARTALLFDAKLATQAALLMSEAKSERIRVALGAALVHAGARDSVPSRELLLYAESLPALAPLALRALAERTDPDLEQTLERYLNGADPLLRAHVARGLGDSADPNASGRLITRYEFEPDASVRQAIVMALAGRRGLLVKRTLELAAALDPSAEVRDAARRVARGDTSRDRAPPRELCWVELATTRPDAKPDAAVLLVVGPGLALPVFPDPDGMLIVPGVSAEPLELRFPAALSL